MSEASPAHVPVMCDRVLALLSPALERAGSVLVDATLGLGGHAQAALERFPALRLVGLDRDPRALESAGRRLEDYADRLTLVHAVYDEIPGILAGLGLPRVDGILFDLGVSSMQLDLADRGFSYSQDAPLDMRMDSSSQTPTAADILNSYDVAALARVLRVYGEERFARRIAERIVAERRREPFARTGQLVEAIRASIPAPARRHGGNPAKRTFQALRIEVNAELDALRAAVPAAIGALALGGRVAVLSYQSLEDRIVKSALAAASTESTPPGLPVVPEYARPQLRLLTRGAERPDDDEVAANPRSASARLRAAERVREAAAA